MDGGGPKTAVEDRPLELHGPPPRLAGIGRPPGPLTPFARVELETPYGAEAIGPLVAQAAPAGTSGQAWVWVTIPVGTPPGSYRGVIHWGEATQPVLVEVEAAERVNLLPERFDVRAVAGSELSARFQVLNSGNVPVEIPRAAAFALADARLVARVVGQSSTVESQEGGQALFQLGEELVASRGGVARIRFSEGSGSLEPGDLRQVQASIRLPAALRTGWTYSGSWRLGDSGFSVRVDVVAGRPSRARKQEEGTE